MKPAVQEKSKKANPKSTLFLIMTYVCASYVFVSPLMFGMTNRPMAYLLGGALTLVILLMVIFKLRREDAKGKA